MARLLDQFRLEPREGAPSLRLTRDLVVRGLGLVYVIAFLSAWVQVEGLIGSEGVLPAARTAEVAGQMGAGKWVTLPSLYWLWPTDAMLHLLCGAGVLLGLAVIAGLFQGAALVLLWACYLSLYGVFQLFLGFQWDILLLEATVVALLIAPWRTWAHRAPEPSPLGITAVRALHWKVMFLAGFAKLASGDPAWRDLTALTWHYWTQPLPNPVSWYVARLPTWFHQASAAGMFAAELVLPWLFLFGRIPRVIALAGTVLLMGGLQLTGNFGFFQVLTLVVALSLLDDPLVHRITGIPFAAARTVVDAARPPERTSWGVGFWVAVLAALNALVLWRAVLGPATLPERAERVVDRTRPFHLAHAYGLFASMTKVRPEITIEGSRDGSEWTAYDFRYKPGPLDEAPPVVAPHMPRLDWQMWFAALGTCDRNAWVVRLMFSLREGSEPVLGLFEGDPFAGDPPDYVRARIQRYQFAEPGSERWWRTVGEPQLYCPVLGPEGLIPLGEQP